MDTLTQLFSYICGQEHCSVIGGIVLPVCQRCMGLYIGAAYALACVTYFRPRPTSATLWIHGLMMLVMAPFGYHLVSQGPVLRITTGVLFGFCLIYYLVLNPALHAGLFERSRGRIAYWTALTPCIPILLIATRSHSYTVAWILVIAAVTGVVACAGLVLVNAVMLPIALATLVRNHLAGHHR